MRHIALIAMFAALLLVPRPARAQREYQQVLSANPLGLVTKWFNVEYERKLGPMTTVAVSASTFLEASDYSNAQLVFRYYPRRALTGFYLGGSTGIFHLAYQHTTQPGAGVEFGTAWLVGQKRNVSVSLGFGITRLFGDGPSDEYLLPKVRFVNVGVAF